LATFETASRKGNGGEHDVAKNKGANVIIIGNGCNFFKHNLPFGLIEKICIKRGCMVINTAWESLKTFN